VRGDIYRLRVKKHAHGHEQHGIRYAVVIQADYLNLSTLLVAPTSTSVRPCDFRPTITIDGTETRILVEQTAAVNAETRLGDFAGRLDAEELGRQNQILSTPPGSALKLTSDRRGSHAEMTGETTTSLAKHEQPLVHGEAEGLIDGERIRSQNWCCTHNDQCTL